MKLYVGNIAKGTTEAQLSELVKPFGATTSVEIAKDRSTGEIRGFGFVEFTNEADAKKAIEGLNGKDFNGQALKVNESRPKTAGAGAR